MGRAGARRARTAVLVGLALVGTSLLPRAALAETRADKTAAQKLLTQGNQAVGEGDYLTALDRFKRAYARYPSPKVLVNIGSTERLLGRYVDAAATYETYLADPGADKTRIPEVTRALKELDALTSRVRIVTHDPVTSVRLDGKEVPKFTSGAAIRIEPGDHTIVAVRDGFPPALRAIQLKPSEEATVTLEFKPAEKVIVRTAGPQRTFAFVVGGIGAAGVIGGLAVGAAALATKHAVSGHCFSGTNECDAQGVDLASRARTFGNVSTGVVIGGLALLGTGVVLLVTAPTETTTKPGADKAVALSFGATGRDATLLLGATW